VEGTSIEGVGGIGSETGDRAKHGQILSDGNKIDAKAEVVEPENREDMMTRETEGE